MAYPTTFLDIQDAVLAKVRMADSTATRNLVKDWINQSYAQVCMETQALQEAGDALLTANSPTYTLPSHIIELKDVLIREAGATAFSSPLRKATLDEVLNWRQGNPSGGTVQAYALIGLNQLELYPPPSTAGTIRFYYSYLPTALSADADVPVLQEPWASTILTYGALAHAAEMQADPLGPTWTASYQDWKMRFRVHVNRRGGMLDYFPVQPGSPIPHSTSADVR